MKYVAFWEFDPADFGKVIEKFKKYGEKHKENPEEYVKYIFAPHTYKWNKGIGIIEVDDPKQLSNSSMSLFPEVKIVYYPLQDAKDVIGALMRVKK